MRWGSCYIKELAEIILLTNVVGEGMRVKIGWEVLLALCSDV
jgi:hypothetical protein